MEEVVSKADSKNSPSSDKKITSPGKANSSDKAEPKEIGGPKGLEPTRYGDWERKGITSDF
jgi:hypothetical protein